MEGRSRAPAGPDAASGSLAGGSQPTHRVDTAVMHERGFERRLWSRCLCRRLDGHHDVEIPVQESVCQGVVLLARPRQGKIAPAKAFVLLGSQGCGAA
jgi:hypothetical protein